MQLWYQEVMETAAINVVMEMQSEKKEKVPDVSQAVTTVDRNKVMEMGGVQANYCFNPEFYEIRIVQLQREIELLMIENDNLRRRIFDFKRIVNSGRLCVYYTGLLPKVVLMLAELLEKVGTSSTFPSVTILNLEDQLLLTLTRLRRDLSCQDLAYLFGVGETIARDAFTSTLRTLHKILFASLMDEIPSREKNQILPAECFREYPNTRIVLEFIEISCDIPDDMKQSTSSSNYVRFNTIKWLIGSGTHGEVTYCSNAYPGSTLDNALVHHSEILSQMHFGDTILADDYRFQVIVGLLPFGVSLAIPPFLTDPQFTEDKVFESRLVSGGKIIHIERIRARLKRFRILRHIPAELFPLCDLLVQTCCALINLQNPLSQEFE